MPLVAGQAGRRPATRRRAGFATPASCSSRPRVDHVRVPARLVGGGEHAHRPGRHLVPVRRRPGTPARGWRTRTCRRSRPAPWPTSPTARARAAKLAPFFGEAFGTVYDLSTVVILWFAGASAMAGLLNLVPQYLPRYGMAPEWRGPPARWCSCSPVINLSSPGSSRPASTPRASAYATGVLVLITSACVATVIDRWNHRQGAWWWPARRGGTRSSQRCSCTRRVDVRRRASRTGSRSPACFIAAILVTSFLSRARRSRELRFAGFDFADPESQLLWDTIRHLELTVLVPHRPGRRSLVGEGGADPAASTASRAT